MRVSVRESVINNKKSLHPQAPLSARDAGFFMDMSGRKNRYRCFIA